MVTRHPSVGAQVLQDFIQILDDAADLVASQLRALCSGERSALTAAKTVGCGLERVLLGAAAAGDIVGRSAAIGSMSLHIVSALTLSLCIQNLVYTSTCRMHINLSLYTFTLIQALHERKVS